VTIPLLFGPYGVPTSDGVDRFAAYGANAAWFHGFNSQAFEACEASHIAACVEFKTFRADFDKHPELIPIGVDGLPIRYGRLVQGVCLSQQAFLEEIDAALLDGLRSFKPAGIWFDYLTYGGWFETPNPDLQESCFCAECIDEFCQAPGSTRRRPLRSWAPMLINGRSTSASAWPSTLVDMQRWSAPICRGASSAPICVRGRRGNMMAR